MPKGFRALFNAKDLAGWYGWNPHSSVKLKDEKLAANLKQQRVDFSKHWRVDGGELVNAGTGPYATTDAEFGDIELELDWKVAPQANSGVFYGVVEDPAGKSPIYATGPEYQLIDEDGWNGPLEAWQKSGADYAMHPPRLKAVKRVGQWNHTRIVVKGTHVRLELAVDGSNGRAVDELLDDDRPVSLQFRGNRVTSGVGTRETGRVHPLSLPLRPPESAAGRWIRWSLSRPPL